MVNKPEEVKKIDRYQNWIAEPKFDGIRCYLQNIDDRISLVREDGTVKTAQFPEIINSIQIPENTILDGEVCILKDDFKADFFTLLTRQTSNPKKIAQLSKSIPCSFVAFDIVQLDGSNTKKDSIESRYSMLNEVREFNESRGRPTDSPLKIIQRYEPNELYPLIKKFDMEGIVLKEKNSDYNGSWKKLKNYEEKDFEVVGYTKSETKSICAFNLIDENGQDVGKVSNTKFKQTKDNENLLIEKLKTKGKLTAVVQYMPMNKGKLRFPVLKELRIE